MKKKIKNKKFLLFIFSPALYCTVHNRISSKMPSMRLTFIHIRFKRVNSYIVNPERAGFAKTISVLLAHKRVPMTCIFFVASWAGFTRFFLFFSRLRLFLFGGQTVSSPSSKPFTITNVEKNVLRPHKIIQFFVTKKTRFSSIFVQGVVGDG